MEKKDDKGWKRRTTKEDKVGIGLWNRMSFTNDNDQ